MYDVYDKEVRSAIMQKVKSRGNNSTEIRLIKFFHEEHIVGWRRNYPVKGHPDFVFLDKRVAIFVDGCFWHGHNCRNVAPKNNKEFWVKKFLKNQARDKMINKLFEERGWTVIRIWECELKKKNRHIVKGKLIAAKIC